MTASTSAPALTVAVSTSVLLPALALVLWTHVMWAWMYATRLPAMFAVKMKLDNSLPRGQLMNQLPASVRWKADNYNHLFEHPTLFYALCIILALLPGGASATNLSMAWAYVVLRVLHSVVQATINNIPLRFTLFFLSCIASLPLTLNAITLCLWAAE